jgi:large subunit ribosomal protein L9
LYGSVTSVDIASTLAAKAVEVDRRKIVLVEPLAGAGEKIVPIKIHGNLTA